MLLSDLEEHRHHRVRVGAAPACPIHFGFIASNELATFFNTSSFKTSLCERCSYFNTSSFNLYTYDSLPLSAASAFAREGIQGTHLYIFISEALALKEGQK